MSTSGCEAAFRYHALLPAGSAGGFPPIGSIFRTKRAVVVQLEYGESLWTTFVGSFPPISANRATVQKSDAIDLNLFQMMQVTSQNQFHVRLCFGDHFVKVWRVTCYQRGGSGNAGSLGLGDTADS